MKNRFEAPNDSEQLSEEAAHEEANLLRAQMNVSPETGKMQGPDPRLDREPTPEDYDKALEAVEELKRVVRENPESLEVLSS